MTTVKARLTNGEAAGIGAALVVLVAALVVGGFFFTSWLVMLVSGGLYHEIGWPGTSWSYVGSMLVTLAIGLVSSIAKGVSIKVNG